MSLSTSLRLMKLAGLLLFRSRIFLPPLLLKRRILRNISPIPLLRSLFQSSLWRTTVPLQLLEAIHLSSDLWWRDLNCPWSWVYKLDRMLGNINLQNWSWFDLWLKLILVIQWLQTYCFVQRQRSPLTQNLSYIWSEGNTFLTLICWMQGWCANRPQW